LTGDIGPTEPRKRPRQARSRATVAALLEAAAQVLIAHGYKGATTARVAERAGVSVGSLYQYFPNKNALIAALVEQHAGRIVAAMEEALSPDTAATLEEGLDALIRTALDTQRIDPELHRIMIEQIPRIGRMAEVMDTSRRIARLIEEFLRRHRERLPRNGDPQITALVMETVLEAITHRALADQLLSDEQTARELRFLLRGYLAPAEAAQSQ